MTTVVREDRTTYIRSVEADGIVSEAGWVVRHLENGGSEWEQVGEVYIAPMVSIKDDDPNCDYDHDGCIRNQMVVEWDVVDAMGEDVAL